LYTYLSQIFRVDAIYTGLGIGLIDYIFSTHIHMEGSHGRQEKKLPVYRNMPRVWDVVDTLKPFNPWVYSAKFDSYTSKGYMHI